MNKSYFQVSNYYFFHNFSFCFGSYYLGYKGFDYINEKIESVIKEHVLSKQIVILCFLFICKSEISAENNLHIFINCLHEYTATGESLE